MATSYYIQVILTLGVLIGMLFIIQKFTKGIYRKKFSGDIKILDRMPVDSNSSLVYLECNNIKVLVASNSKSIEVLHKWV